MPLARLSFLAGVVLLIGASAIPSAAQAPDALLGRWHVTRIITSDGGRTPAPDAPSHFTFTEKGLLHIERVGERAEQVRADYRVKGDMITIDFKQRGATERVRFELQNDQLRLSDEARSTTVVFQRVSS